MMDLEKLIDSASDVDDKKLDGACKRQEIRVKRAIFDGLSIEEAYDWQDDIMRITRRIVNEMDEKRLNSVAEHFEVDLSEIREYINLKYRQKAKTLTHYDQIREMRVEDMAAFAVTIEQGCPPGKIFSQCALESIDPPSLRRCKLCWLEWLKEEA